MSSVPDSAPDLLAFAAGRRAAADAAEAELLATAVAWAAAHSTLGITPEQQRWEQGIPLAGEGAPDVAEFCIAEFAAVIGMTTDSGRRYIGDALELAHRLPQIFARTQSGTLQVWRARRIAQATLLLPRDAAAYVDGQVAHVAHKVGMVSVERLVREAMERYAPEQAVADDAAKSDPRKVDVHSRDGAFHGCVDIAATVDLADAHAFEQAIARRAELLAEAGSTESLDARRAAALGEMARADLALDLATGERTADGAPAGPTKELRLHVNASDLEAAIHGEPLDGAALVRVEHSGSFVDIDTLRTWIAKPGTHIAVRTVIDTSATVRVDQWEIPDRLRRLVEERDGTCRFPHCNRPARNVDVDHIEPYDVAGPPGQTSSGNCAGLCRRHHRHKTHGRWKYRMLDPGYYLWTSPHGHRFLVTPHGTETL